VRRPPRQLYSLRPFKLQLRHGQSTLGEPTPQTRQPTGNLSPVRQHEQPRETRYATPIGLHSMPGSASLSPCGYTPAEGRAIPLESAFGARARDGRCVLRVEIPACPLAMRRGSLPA